MKFRETKLAGAWVIEPEPVSDDRGLFARLWCREELRRHGLSDELAQISTSFNRTKGTLRGMHYQASPHEEIKIVRCTKGSIYDVILDLRPDSATHKRWVSEELSEENRRMLYVPKGFAHGFVTLEDETEVLYQISEPYHPESARGVRWNDPAFGIRWPVDRPFLSERDGAFPDAPR